MAEITESRIQDQMSENAYEYGIDRSLPYAHELAELQLKDLQRKGCTLEGPDCRSCQFLGQECPLQTWVERHPEFKNDELAHRIEVLEAGGEEAYKEKLKRIEEAKKQKEAHEQALADAKKKIDAAVIKIRNETDDDKAWWKELDDAVEAYVQMRMKKV